MAETHSERSILSEDQKNYFQRSFEKKFKNQKEDISNKGFNKFLNDFSLPIQQQQKKNYQKKEALAIFLNSIESRFESESPNIISKNMIDYSKHLQIFC